MLRSSPASNKRTWNPIRILRHNSSKDCVQDDLQGAAVESTEMELESRVMQWLQSSKPPSFSSRKHGSILEENISDEIEHETISKISDDSLESSCVLYHPDFADWASVRLSEAQASPFKSLDDATASITNLLKIPLIFQ